MDNQHSAANQAEHRPSLLSITKAPPFIEGLLNDLSSEDMNLVVRSLSLDLPNTDWDLEVIEAARDDLLSKNVERFTERYPKTIAKIISMQPVANFMGATEVNRSHGLEDLQKVGFLFTGVKFQLDPKADVYSCMNGLTAALESALEIFDRSCDEFNAASYGALQLVQFAKVLASSAFSKLVYADRAPASEVSA